MIIAILVLTGCTSNPSSSDQNITSISIEGQWKADNGDECYINTTDIFDSGFAIPYEIRSDKELMIVDATGNERIVEYSISGDILTLKLGQQGVVYHRVKDE